MFRDHNPYRVEDPRFGFWVAKGLWPDCPDCHGLRAANEGPRPRDFLLPGEEPRQPEEIPFPCPTCHARTEGAGIEIPKHFWHRGLEAIYGAWPDCQECSGEGVHWYSIQDGYESERKFSHCQTCRTRTIALHESNPTDLDLLLKRLKEEANPHIASLRAHLQGVSTDTATLEVLDQQHRETLKPEIEKISKQVFSGFIRAD